MKRLCLTLFLSAVSTLLVAAPTTLLQNYRGAASQPFSADAGRQLWERTEVDPESGQPRRCATCHGDNLKAAGKHARSGKVIEPMAPSVNPERLTELKKVEKWFTRNCKWTWGRECTDQEKGDLLKYLSTL